MSRRIYRYEVPVDDLWHYVDLTGAGEILAVAARLPEVVDIWAYHDNAPPAWRIPLRVVGTGQPLPDHPGGPASYVGTAVAPGGQLVWHVIKGPEVELR